MDEFGEQVGHVVEVIVRQLTELDSPLAAASIIVAALIFLAKSVFRPVWRASAMRERRMLNQLRTALTYIRFQEILGQEPNAYRELGEDNLESPKPLESRFFVLRRTYVEAFVDSDNRIYGYTVTLRRPTWMGTIDFAGIHVRLGWTSLNDAWADIRPTLLAIPLVRDYSLFELTTPSGASTGRSWAIGFQDSGPYSASPFTHWWNRTMMMVGFLWSWLRGSRDIPRALLKRAHESPEEQLRGLAHSMGWDSLEFATLPSGWNESSAVQNVRSHLRVNSVSVTVNDGIRYPMLTLHSWDTFWADPPDARARLQRRQYRREKRRDRQQRLKGPQQVEHPRIK